MQENSSGSRQMFILMLPLVLLTATLIEWTEVRVGALASLSTIAGFAMVLNRPRIVGLLVMSGGVASLALGSKGFPPEVVLTMISAGIITGVISQWPRQVESRGVVIMPQQNGLLIAAAMAGVVLLASWTGVPLPMLCFAATGGMLLMTVAIMLDPCGRLVRALARR